MRLVRCRISLYISSDGLFIIILVIFRCFMTKLHALQLTWPYGKWWQGVIKSFFVEGVTPLCRLIGQYSNISNPRFVMRSQDCCMVYLQWPLELHESSTRWWSSISAAMYFRIILRRYEIYDIIPVYQHLGSVGLAKICILFFPAKETCRWPDRILQSIYQQVFKRIAVCFVLFCWCLGHGVLSISSSGFFY